MFPKFIDYVLHIPDKNVPLLSIFLFQIFLYSVKKKCIVVLVISYYPSEMQRSCTR